MTVRIPSPPRLSGRVRRLADLLGDGAAEPSWAEEARAWYAAERVNPEALVDEPASACPWCGSESLSLLCHLVDTRQVKPGRFRMDRCADCGHVFQNPRLSARGLTYYYRDAYDGAGAGHYAASAELGRRSYEDRVRLLGCPRPPRRWLDLGARHGHLCREVRARYPSAHVTAVERSPEIAAARQRGWLDEALPFDPADLVAARTEKFDAISMIHYLERVVDPVGELGAVRELLAPGGSVLIETVNPESRFAWLYGKYWHGWLAPHNLHLIPHDNLVQKMNQIGLDIRACERGSANKPFDTVGALLSLLNRHLPPAPSWPWTAGGARPHAGALRQLAMFVATPLMLIALLIDRVLHEVTRRGPGGNTYRIVAVGRTPTVEPQEAGS